ncbi:putative head structural protein [Pseudomonas phage Psa21]|uniref:Putative head structural protein n=1 Tax=Pseudomonas phage Psa21 TaxID=2530023 RepID=A0A481W4B3_9CAUD|nr:putative head structural protein [Pseudomonas phage Psa21]QBJ02546.1 putative head structural protein [Pseudomonas phage Psa21]
MNDTTTIFDLLSRHFADVKFDRAFCMRVINFVTRFMNKNQDHSAFFGGALLGVNPVRWHPTDREQWYDEVLKVNDDLLQYDFLKLDVIDPSHNVNSDSFNHIPAFVCRKLMENTQLPMNLRDEAMIAMFTMLHIKYLTSLLSRRFSYPAKREVAEATFMSLNYKWDIRRLGSWHALIRDRCLSIIGPETNYTDHIFGSGDSLTDYWSTRIVTDTQSRIREVINKIYAVYIQVLKEGGRVITTSEMGMSTDGDLFLKDKVNGFGTYLRYGKEIVTNEANFIRPELLGIIERAMVDSMPSQPFEDTLKYICRNVTQARHAHIDKMFEECLLYVFDQMQAERTQIQRSNDLEGLILKIRSKLMASRSSDPRVLYLREVGEKIVADATGVKNKAVLAATRTGVMLYITLRTLTKNHYAR